jgi:radical SAM superfamily enzyme
LTFCWLDIKITFKEEKKMEKEWKSTVELGHELGISDQTIRRYIRKHRQALLERGVIKEEKRGIKLAVWKIGVPGEEFIRIIKELEAK